MEVHIECNYSLCTPGCNNGVDLQMWVVSLYRNQLKQVKVKVIFEIYIADWKATSCI